MSQSISQKFTPISLLKFALPSMVMMMFMSCYTIVDGIFISRYLGSEALSAANIVYPVFNLLLAVGIMFATGGSAVVSKKLGEGKKEEAMEDFSFLTAVGVALSVLLMIATLLFHNQISLFLGSSERILDYCNAYLIYLVLFAPACMLQSLYQSFFVTAGKPRLGLVLTVIAGLANAFFDYFFLAACGMEIEGAAIATGIGQMIPAVVGTVYFFFFKGELHFVPFHFHGATLKQSCFNGSSEMVSNLANAIITYLFNIILMRIAGENGVAAITIILYAQFLFNSLYLGFSIGVAPVIGFQYGAKNRDQLKSLYKICNCFVIASSVVIAFFSWLLSDGIASIFVQDRGETYVMASEGLRIFALSFLFSGFNIFSSSLFTALSDGKTSAIISFGRTCVFIILSLMILPNILGLTGVWLAIPVAEFLAVFVSVYYQWTKRKKYGYL